MIGPVGLDQLIEAMDENGGGSGVQPRKRHAPEIEAPRAF
jgi:hypothetical protein